MALKYILEKEAVESGRKTFTVAELTRQLRLLVERGFSNVCVEGELSNFKAHSSGHMYFSLKDSQAQLTCVMFRQHNHSLGFDMADGMQVICSGRISVYEPRGQYQLYVERVEPKGVGALQLRFEKLKEKLRAEGLFDEARKRPLPFLAGRIALVTSLDGAALRDILNVLGRRFSSAHLLIYPVPVQGAQASSAIAEAITDLNEAGLADVMILARGGGSLEDLWAFNEEAVARAIVGSDIPVISAIGHETDYTIADFVADLRAPTPSAAAELVLPRREDLLSRILELRSRASQTILEVLGENRQRLKELCRARVLRGPLSAFEARFQRLDELARSLAQTFRAILLEKKESAARLVGKLEALGPLETLKRGFSVSLKLPGEKVVSTVRALTVGDEIKTKLHDGFFKSRVTEVSHGG